MRQTVQRRAIYPGSFDVLTYGHLDIIQRGARLYDVLIVGVAENPKKKPVFDRSERVDMLKEATKQLKGVVVKDYGGLTVDFALANNAPIILRGLRFVSDFEFELQVAMANREMTGTIETVFMAPSPQFSFLSSSIVKQLALHRRDVGQFVPPVVARALAGKYGPPNHSGEMVADDNDLSRGSP